MARHIIEVARPQASDPERILGFAVGPITMDEGADGARSIIRDAFDVALHTDLAVALHLDDYMFWREARWPDGRLLRADSGTLEWRDWSGTPAPDLQIGWLPNVELAPQMCYESPQASEFADHWTREVIGLEIKRQIDRLAQAGKPQLFAGVIAGWESNLAYGYCSLSHLGYSAQRQPADFDHERERVLQRHIERWAKGIADAGIPASSIYTHIGPLPRRDFEAMRARFSPAQLREMPQSTAFRAFWTAFNKYSSAGFSAYQSEGRFADIYRALQAHGATGWAMAEGTNAALDGPPTSPLDWETYLARNFNHGARVVDLFFLSPPGVPANRATDSAPAVAAYRKFLRGERLVETGSDK